MLVTVASGTAPCVELPPVECVAALRAARIALAGEGAAAALAALEGADEVCEGHVDLLLERIALHRLVGAAALAEADLEALAARLADPERPLALGAVVRTLIDGVASEELLDLLAGRLERELVASPGDRVLLRALAVTRSRLGEDVAAREALARLLAVEPTEEVRWALVRMDVALARWENAIPELERLVAEPGRGSVAARVHLVRAYGAVGRSEDAVRVARQLERVAGAGSQAIRALVAGALVDAAWDLHDAGERDRAKTLFRSALELDPDRDEARLALELADATPEQRLERARSRGVVAAPGDDPAELLEEGTRRLAVGDDLGALSALEPAARALPGNELAWYSLGLAAVRLERWQLAAEALARAVELDPSNPASRLNLGTAQARLGRCEAAVASLEALLGDHPGTWQAHYWLATCYAELGDDAKAREAMARYQDQRPEGP